MLSGSFLERGYRRAVDRLLVRLLAPSTLRPDWLTIGGLALSVLAGVCALRLPFLAGVLILLAGLLDTLDGALSRATGRATSAGARLDSTCDRYGEFAALFGAWGRLALLGYAGWAGLLALAALQGSLMVSYARARAEGLGLRLRGGIFERPERVLVLAFGFLASPLEPAVPLPTGAFLGAALALLAVGANGTAVRRIFRARRALAAPSRRLG
jgi:CDP-diacylglycerol---glycerol-3-phosphate 3-phosphatidyltransferase